MVRPQALPSVSMAWQTLAVSQQERPTQCGPWRPAPSVRHSVFKAVGLRCQPFGSHGGVIAAHVSPRLVHPFLSRQTLGLSALQSCCDGE